MQAIWHYLRDSCSSVVLRNQKHQGSGRDIFLVGGAASADGAKVWTPKWGSAGVKHQARDFFLAGARAPIDDNSIEVHQGGVAGGQCAQHQD